MKARWLTLIACVPLIIGTMLLQSCGGVGGPNNPATSPGSNAPTQNFLALLTPEQKSAKTIGPAACGAVGCHGPSSSPHVAMKLASLRKQPADNYTEWKETMHAKKGVTCEACHGPGSAHKANPKNADGTPHAILTFPKIASVEVCGQCHGPEHDEWKASKHNNLITIPIDSTIANPVSSGQTSRCMLCHGGLVRAEYTENGVDPSQMTTTQIVNVCNDIEKVLPSVNVCVTCHDPHAKTGNLTGKGKEAQLYHSVALTDSTNIAPGTTPAQYTGVNQICGQCHNGRATNGTDTFLTANTSRPSAHHSNEFNTLLGVGGAESPSGPPTRSGTHALAPGQCTTCHMPLSRHTMTVSYENSCSPCHTTADAAARAANLQSEITNSLTTLQVRMSNWANTTFGDPTFWDYTSNIASGKTAPKQTLIPIQVKRARHNYYYIIISGDLGVHNPAYTRYLLDWAATNLTSIGVPSVKPEDVARTTTAEKVRYFKQLRQRIAATTED